MELYVYAALIFVLSFLLQMVLCFSKHVLVSASLFFLCLASLLYAGARFLGIIRYPSDTTGIFDGGLFAGIFIGVLAISAFIGILAAWAIFFMVKWRQSNGCAHKNLPRKTNHEISP